MGKKARPLPPFLTIKIDCPKCGEKIVRKVKVPVAELHTRHVECLKCGHKWTYRGMLTYRIRCPKCGSSQNEVNRKTFGRYKSKE